MPSEGTSAAPEDKGEGLRLGINMVDSHTYWGLGRISAGGCSGSVEGPSSHSPVLVASGPPLSMASSSSLTSAWEIRLGCGASAKKEQAYCHEHTEGI